MADKQYIVIPLSQGVRGVTLEDTDLWGLVNALNHGIDDGYFKDNEEWAKVTVNRLQALRGIPDQLGKERDAGL
jgi:hypothetical protein